MMCIDERCLDGAVGFWFDLNLPIGSGCFGRFRFGRFRFGGAKELADVSRNF